MANVEGKLEVNNTDFTGKSENEKWMALSSLKQGSIVKLTSGETATFTRLKQSKFIGMINGGSFDIPVTMLLEIIEEAKANDGYKKLKKNELFYIVKGKDTILFIFDCMEKGYIIGINPISKGKTRIDISLYGGAVKEITKELKSA
jgi:hypothetical protein